jgi:uncharacterized phage-associated protein
MCTSESELVRAEKGVEMASASEIARYIVGFFHEEQEPITNLRLQKLLYYVQGWSLAILDRPAFSERLEAGAHGPVQRGVYDEYAEDGWKPIDKGVAMPPLDSDLRELIELVLQAYGGESGYALEIRTHHEAPWLEARNRLDKHARSDAVISQESMKGFFKNLGEHPATS